MSSTTLEPNPDATQAEVVDQLPINRSHQILIKSIQIALHKPRYMNTMVYIRSDKEENKSKWFGFRKYNQINWESEQLCDISQCENIKILWKIRYPLRKSDPCKTTIITRQDVESMVSQKTGTFRNPDTVIKREYRCKGGKCDVTVSFIVPDDSRLTPPAGTGQDIVANAPAADAPLAIEEILRPIPIDQPLTVSSDIVHEVAIDAEKIKSVRDRLGNSKRQRKAPIVRKAREIVRGLLVDHMTMRPFKFCALKLTDDDSYFNNGTCSEKLGSLEITFEYVKIVRSMVTFTSVKQNEAFGNDLVHEKTKKLVSHCVGTSEETIVLKRSPTSLVIEPFDKDNLNPGPAVTLSFKYRPRDFLKAQGFVEPKKKPVEAPSPSPPQTRGLGKKRRNAVEDVKRENESEGDEEDEEIRRLEAELKRRKQNCKRRRTDDVKKEPKEDPDVVPKAKLLRRTG